MTISIPDESSAIVKETLQKEVNRLKEKIVSLNQHLLTFEKKFHFSSEDFQKKWNNGELGDDQIFFEWFADLETRDRIKKRLILLEKVKLDN
ncbi:MAG: hypothetical protein EAX86_07000 [Candidatus Heimdallarchaeota archaeon]|nr:hypothetical protein [Candidatus Heimdallarchaeota archaeon]